MFARHYLRNLGWFLFLELLRCFSSLGLPPSPYIFRSGYPCGWVSPFGHLRIKAYLPAPRSFSQAITSFIACNRQGIHHMHLFTWPYNVKTWTPFWTSLFHPDPAVHETRAIGFLKQLSLDLQPKVLQGCTVLTGYFFCFIYFLGYIVLCRLLLNSTTPSNRN
jgi:hypothetical protein